MQVVARSPDTTFIAAHFADLCDDLQTLSGFLDRCPNLYVEFAGRIAELGRQPYSARDFFLKHQDRILFGTDGVPPMSELIPHFQMLETRDEYFRMRTIRSLPRDSGTSTGSICRTTCCARSTTKMPRESFPV